MKHTALLISSCIVFATSPASADTFIESFDGGSNEGSWTFGSPNGATELFGGNPSRFFHDSFLDTFAPRPRTAFGAASEFAGSYREKGVTSVGIDLILFDVDFSAGGRPLTVMLISDNSTPGDFSDDWAAYLIGPDNVPLVGQGWLSYDFEIPSQSETLPIGWQTVIFGPNSPVDPDWNDVITNVAQLRYFYGDPTFFFIFQGWDLGMDNPRIITTAEPCPADFDGNGTVEAFDLAMLLGNWGACAGCPADLDGDGTIGAADLAELLGSWGPCP
ncbi:MAG: hypothetical protein O7D91_12815 [Planctomycetota bacterium]|nr:hypothetical protein [Planctomycetota bacterium]